MGRSPCCDKEGLKKGPWTPEEDMKLAQYIHTHCAGNWKLLPKNAGIYYILHIQSKTLNFLDHKYFNQ